jgi:hypothetical protein
MNSQAWKFAKILWQPNLSATVQYVIGIVVKNESGSVCKIQSFRPQSSDFLALAWSVGKQISSKQASEILGFVSKLTRDQLAIPGRLEQIIGSHENGVSLSEYVEIQSPDQFAELVINQLFNSHVRSQFQQSVGV